MSVCKHLQPKLCSNVYSTHKCLDCLLATMFISIYECVFTVPALRILSVLLFAWAREFIVYTQNRKCRYGICMATMCTSFCPFAGKGWFDKADQHYRQAQGTWSDSRWLKRQCRCRDEQYCKLKQWLDAGTASHVNCGKGSNPYFFS